jgi:peptide/nickel transport system substrate-binding protein
MSRDLPKALAEANGGDDEITRLPFIAPEMLGFNHSLAPIDNPDVRRAISLAIDRKDLIERLGFGEGQANGPIPFGLPVWALPQGEIDEFYAIDSYDANLAEARALIEAAGGDALPELNIINQNDIAIAADMGPLIAGMLESAGLKVQLMPAATLEWITNLYGGDAWHLSINQWGNALDPMFYLSQYTGPDVQVLSNNRSFGGGSAEIDSAVNALLAEFDPQARVEKVLEAQRAILESYSSVLNLFDPYAYYLRKPYLKDFRAGDNEATYLQWDYWIDQG